MKARDYEAVTHDAEVYCVGCLPGRVAIDDFGVGPIFASSEWDRYPVCCKCGEEHNYVSLTTEGQRWLAKRQ